jgi:hypothetical protein
MVSPWFTAGMLQYHVHYHGITTITPRYHVILPNCDGDTIRDYGTKIFYHGITIFSHLKCTITMENIVIHSIMTMILRQIPWYKPLS